MRMMGPVDYVVVGFEGGDFDGSILEALSDAVESGAIRVIDLVFVMKDKKGDTLFGEIADQDDDLKELAELLGVDQKLSLFSEKDLEKIASEMANDTSAGLLVIEHLWAKDLKKALADRDALIIDQGRIQPELVEAAIEELSAQPA
jgi:hypothetical protein